MWVEKKKYYIEYFAVYSILMKIGIKCEIHDCTIALVTLLEEERIIPEGFADILSADKELRIDNQYYLKNKPVAIDFSELAEFLLHVRGVLESLGNGKIREIRRRIAEG